MRFLKGRIPWNKGKKGLQVAWNKGKMVSVKCLACKKKIEFRETESRKFCSRRCLGKWNSKNLYGERHPNWRGGKKKKICDKCNKIFYVWNYLKNSKFCSSHCANESKKGKPTWMSRGVKVTWGWKISKANKGRRVWNKGKGKYTNLARSIRDNEKYKNWRKQIFERDNYTCVSCGKIGGKLNADHFPLAFSKILRKFVKENPNKDNKKLFFLSLNFILFWDISNGRTLCLPCHKETPNFGGKKVKS